MKEVAVEKWSRMSCSNYTLRKEKAKQQLDKDRRRQATTPNQHKQQLHIVKEPKNQRNPGKTRLPAGGHQGYPSQGNWSLSAPVEKTVAPYV